MAELRADDGRFPGTEAYSPIESAHDPRFNAGYAQTQKQSPLGAGVPVAPSGLRLPDPSIGGHAGPEGQLGWSEGFGAARMAHSFRGQALEVAPMGAHPVEGHVGLSTRSQRLKTGVSALYQNLTPSDEDVAREYVNKGLI